MGLQEKKARPPGHALALSQRLCRQEASFSLCKALGSFLSPLSLLSVSLHPASNFVSGLGIPETSAIVFCPTTHVQAEGLGRVTTCKTQDTEKPGHHPCRTAPASSCRDQALRRWVVRNAWTGETVGTLQVFQQRRQHQPGTLPLALCGKSKRASERVGLGYIQDLQSRSLLLPLWFSQP